eukprot:g8148.t1
MAGTSPQLTLVEERAGASQEKDEKLKELKKRHEIEAKAGVSSARAACSIYSDIDDRMSEASCLTLVGELMLAKDDVDEAGLWITLGSFASTRGEAKTAAREARDIFQDLEDPYGEARALNLILSANMLHEADAVDALFAAKDVLWLFRGNDILPEEEDKKAIADALHCQAKVHFSIGELADAREVAEESLKYYAQAQMTPKELRLRCIFSDSRILEKRHESLVQFTRSASVPGCFLQGDGDGSIGLPRVPHSERAVELFATAQDQRGEAMAKAILAYQDTMSRMKQLEDTPQAFTEQSNARVTQNWTVIDDAMDARPTEAHSTSWHLAGDNPSSLIYEMNQKVGEIQKKMSTPTKTVWTVDRVTRKAKQKDSAGRVQRSVDRLLEENQKAKQQREELQSVLSSESCKVEQLEQQRSNIQSAAEMREDELQKRNEELQKERDELSGRLDSLEKTLAETKSQQSRDLADGPAGRLSKWLWVMAPGDCG